MRVIKRYANRKLYDLTAKRYVTLKDIARLIQKDHQIRVVDNETNADITTRVLTQVIAELAREDRILSRTLLTGLIRARGSMVHFLGRFLDLAAEAREMSGGDLAKDEQAFEQLLQRLNVASRQDIQRLDAQLKVLMTKIEALQTRRR